jgi:hypothetical protein
MATPALVQTNSVFGAAAVAFTTKNLTQGNLLVSMLRCNTSGITTLACSDNVNGSWTLVSQSAVVTPTFCFAYFIGTAGGSKPTVTWSGFTAGSGVVCISEWSGVNALRTVGTVATSSSGVTSAATNSITPVLGDLVIGGLAVSGISTLVNGSGWTNAVSGESGGTDVDANLEYQISTGIATDATWTWSGTTPSDFAAGIIAFYMSSGGASQSWLTVDLVNSLRGLRH